MIKMPRCSQIAVSARTDPYAELKTLTPGTARSRSRGSLVKKWHSLQVRMVVIYIADSAARRMAENAGHAPGCLETRPIAAEHVD